MHDEDEKFVTPSWEDLAERHQKIINDQEKQLKTLAIRVSEMRMAQRNYFKTPHKLETVKADWLKRSKELEREVDEMVALLINGPDPVQKLF